MREKHEPERLDAARAAQLLDRLDALSREAEGVLDDLKLSAILAAVGVPQRTGSLATGLMVWRDIDLHVVAPGLTVPAAFDCIREIAAHPRMRRVRYLNESGKFNPTGLPRDERFYFGLYCESGSDEWKVDLSFWLKNVPRSELEDVARIRSALTPETRLAILWLKDVWHRLPVYRVEVFSLDIYAAVLEHGVRTPGAFDDYLRQNGKPAHP